MSAKVSKPPTADQMLDWVASFVTEINSLVSKKSRVIEMVAEDQTSMKEQMIIETCTGKTDADAFRKCVVKGMKKYPLQEEGK